jgi:thiamine biosynthesis lipoprotein
MNPPAFPAFHHEAMATDFAVVIADQSPDYARQAAAAAFRELDRLESELSRYVESSDIARANRLAHGESIRIGEDALQCLLLAADAALATGRAFDPAYASEPAPDQPADSPTFTLDPDAFTLTSRAERLHLDLGAVGKGYALDRMAALLNEWGIRSALLQSGGSTALALAPPSGRDGWPVGIGDGASYRILSLSHLALSGSGLAVQGAHIIDPRVRGISNSHARTWALTAGAALSDALSTAFFNLGDAAIAAFCSAHPDIGAARATSTDRLIAFGSLAPRFDS